MFYHEYTSVTFIDFYFKNLKLLREYGGSGVIQHGQPMSEPDISSGDVEVSRAISVYL